MFFKHKYILYMHFFDKSLLKDFLINNLGGTMCKTIFKKCILIIELFTQVYTIVSSGLNSGDHHIKFMNTINSNCIWNVTSILLKWTAIPSQAIIKFLYFSFRNFIILTKFDAIAYTFIRVEYLASEKKKMFS